MGPSKASTAAGRRRASTRATGSAKRTQGARSARAAARAPAPPKRAPRKAAPARPRRPAGAGPRPKAAKPRAARQSRGRWLRFLLTPRGVLAIAALTAVFAAAYVFWLRDLPLFAVKDVKVEGATGPEAAAIAQTLDEAAREMTTLHVDEEALRAAAARFPTFADLRADASFPNGLRITVEERPPVLLARGSDGPVPIAGDGTILAGVETDAKLPVISVDRLPAQGKVRDEALAMARVLGAAPGPLAKLIESVDFSKDYGVEVELQGGIPLRFGGAEQAADKWAAAAAVLAEPEVTSLTYLDLRVPERPAIGGAAAAVAEDAAAG
ncbi:MAG TPA: cell division protein FtsQ/DivIB [Solirubrobacterales bacterium]|jgi:cell division protein FtsQ